MKQLLKRSMFGLVALALCLSLLPMSQITTEAAKVEYVFDSTGKYIYNWGTRGETATFLSPNAESFYTSGHTYDDLSAYPGGTGTANAPSSALYDALQDLMTENHDYETSYNATKDLYQYTDCQNSGKTGKAISSFYSGTAIGPAWGSSPSWNREHTWPNSKGLAGNDENDIMMLRPTASSENTSRGNKAYGKSSGFYNPNGASGGALDLRGDVSRIFLYVYVRWGNVNGNGQYTTWGSTGVMESLDVLLEWMEADPVDTWELGRNDSVEAITGTRNVFVDYPEFAFLLFGEEIPEDMATPSGEAKNAASCAHKYVAGTPVGATCTAEGYTPYTCSLCGKSYKDKFTAMVAHRYVKGACSVCGAKQSRLPVTGEKVVIYAPAYNKALSADKVYTSSYYNKGVDVSAGFSAVTAAERWVVTVNPDGSYSFVSESGSKLALADSYSSLNDTGANNKWTVTAKNGAEGIYYIKNVGRGNYLEWYADKNNWSTYSTSTLTDMFEMSFYITECSHKYSTVVVAPTCTEKGFTTYTCDRCGHSYNGNTVVAKDHNYKNGFCTVCNAKDPQAPEYTIHFLVPQGVTTVNSMVAGKAAVKLPKAGAPKNYTFVGWASAVVNNVTTKPTYLKGGDSYTATANTVLYALYTYKATPAGGSKPVTHYTTVIGTSACTHASTSFTGAKDATCTENGKKADLFCSACKKVLVPGESIPAKGHVEVVDQATEPSCKDSGWTEGKHCERCKKILIAPTEIEALPHIEIVDKGYDATCAKPGMTDGKHCERCNEILIAQEEIDVLEHADEDEDKKCDVCGAQINAAKPPVGLILAIAAGSLLLVAAVIVIIVVVVLMNKKRLPKS